MQWGPEADAKLFMHVLKIHNVKIDYGALAMAMGNDVTPKALTHRIAKLRSMADDASTTTTNTNAALILPQPVTKPRALTPGPAARKKAAINDNNNDDDENENDIKPVSGVGAAGGVKRNATGAPKSPLLNVVVAAAEDADGEEDEDVKNEIPNKKKKVKTGARVGRARVQTTEYA